MTAASCVGDGFFVRIERSDESTDLAPLRENMVLGVSAVGALADAPLHEFVGHGADVQVELSMRARGEDASVAMVVARIGGGRYRITQHLPHREALEGIPASM